MESVTGTTGVDEESVLLDRAPSQTHGDLATKGSDQSRPPLGCNFGTVAGATLSLAALIVFIVDLPVCTPLPILLAQYSYGAYDQSVEQIPLCG